MVLDPVPERLSILRIADNRPSARGQMDTDLVRAASHETAAEQCRADSRGLNSAQPFEHGLTWRTGCRVGRHGPPFLAAARQADVDDAPRDIHPAVNDRQILFLRMSRRKAALEGGVHRTRLGDNEDA